MTNQSLTDIVEFYGLKLVEVDESFLKEADQTWEDVENRSFINHPCVILGRYEDEERRVASMFHEIGHHVAGQENIHSINCDGDDFKVPSELIAWMVGFREAAKHNFHFSAATIQWALEQTLTYRGYK